MIPKYGRRSAFAFAILASLLPSAAHAQFDLTPPYLAPVSSSPWTISTLASGFPSDGYEPEVDYGWDRIYGFAFASSPSFNKGLPYFMVAEVNNGSEANSYPNRNGLVVFNSDKDGQVAGQPLQPLLTPTGLASVGGVIYAEFPTPGSIIPVYPNGTMGEAIGDGLSTLNAICVNPLNGHLLATEWTNQAIFDINVKTKTVTTLLQMKDAHGVAGAAGIATDGTSVFVVVLTQTDGQHVEQYAIPSTPGASVSAINDYGFIYGARGIAIGLGGTGGYIYASGRHGQFYQIDRFTKQISLLSNFYSNGQNAEFMGVDPINGSLLVSGGGIGRLTPPIQESLQYAFPKLAATSVASGKSISGTVYLAVPAPVDFKVTLTASAHVTVSPSTLTIKAGTTSGSFTVTGGAVTANSSATVATSIVLPKGTISQSTVLTVTPH
jgi:hypothetical protein